jgi:hypothetical protein
LLIIQLRLFLKTNPWHGLFGVCKRVVLHGQNHDGVWRREEGG